jgi:CheY-like chemotaxis protein
MRSAGGGDLIALDRRAGKQLTDENFAPIRVLLADGDKLARAELRDSLASARDVAVVGEATSGHEAVALAGETRPDVVLIDAPLPDLGGLEATRTDAQEYGHFAGARLHGGQVGATVAVEVGGHDVLRRGADGDRRTRGERRAAGVADQRADRPASRVGHG